MHNLHNIMIFVALSSGIEASDYLVTKKIIIAEVTVSPKSFSLSLQAEETVIASEEIRPSNKEIHC